MINRTSFVNPVVFDRFARAAFACVISELSNYGDLTANTHALLCHGSLYIRYAQEELGVSIGALSENSIEMGNRSNNNYRKLFCYRGDIRRETLDIFKRRLLVSDPCLVIEGVQEQLIRRGHVLEYWKNVRINK